MLGNATHVRFVNRTTDSRSVDLNEFSVALVINGSAATATASVIRDVAVVANMQFRALLASTSPALAWMQLYNLKSGGNNAVYRADPVGAPVPVATAVARIDSLADRVLLADVTTDRSTLLIGNATTAASTVLFNDVGARWLDFALARCVVLVLRRGESAVIRVDLSRVLCATTVAPPATTATRSTLTFETMRTNTGAGGGVVPGFEGTIDPRSALNGRPPLLGRGVDPARADGDAYGPLSILMIVAAIVACVVLSALLGRAVRNYAAQGRVPANRGNPWRNLAE